ncbi:MAG: sugar phosphate isomerase/epimerase family protein [Limisphaerales bacterium]
MTVAAAAALAGPGRLAVPRAEAGQPKLRPIRLGGPIFEKSGDPETLALAHRKLGYRAAYCPGVSLNDSDRIRALAEAFARHDVVIAEVGRWVNLMDTDPEKRRKNLETVTEGLALAEAIGALNCVDIAGSFSTTSWFGPHPDNLSPRFFDAAVQNARQIIDAVKPKRAKFTYEVMGWALPDSPDSYLRLIKAIDRPAFGVHLDPCNLVNSPAKFYNNTALLNECFDKLGRWIVSCHGKDLAWDVEMNVHFREVIPGQGSLDYATYLKRLAALPHNPPLMLEHLATAQDYDAARLHVFEVGQKEGLSFGASAQ